MDRIAIQAARDDETAFILYDKHSLITRPAPEADDRFSGFDRLQFVGDLNRYDPAKDTVIGGIPVPQPFVAKDWKTCQWKERGRHERTDEPYMEIELEYIRHRRIGPGEPDYWGREWRNRNKGLDYYDMITQDRIFRRFEWGPIRAIMEDWHGYLEGLCESERRYTLGMDWADDWRRRGLMMLSREDNDGRKKNLLYIEWFGQWAARGIKPILELPV